METGSAALGRFSIGVGDRFGRQAEAQLRACLMALEAGTAVTPVWNKSYREHSLIGSEPASARRGADAAARACGWRRPYFVDADHIRLETLGGFLQACDFFTIDVAAAIGCPAGRDALEVFSARHPELGGAIEIAGLDARLGSSPEELRSVAAPYLAAAEEAGRIYRRIAAAKGAGRFITEVSIDEVREPQTPFALLVILAALADQGVPADTIAPRFSGRFNKGVDYVGDVATFEAEFAADVAVLGWAVERYHLPRALKLSVHSGSDKFSLYGPIHRVLARTGAGVHLKTAGTTWLEEIIGLAESGGEALDFAKELYAAAFAEREALAAPYAEVLDIDPARLPAPGDVGRWTAGQFAAALRHDPACPEFNPNLRQLLHVAYPLAARARDRFLPLLEEHRDQIGRNVTGNLLERHIRPLFLGAPAARPE
ncbi:MAG: tagaturonate epimerase family protein [Bryobacteraceae bacterium]|jgi:hypothetical protein